MGGLLTLIIQKMPRITKNKSGRTKLQQGYRGKVFPVIILVRNKQNMSKCRQTMLINPRSLWCYGIGLTKGVYKAQT